MKTLHPPPRRSPGTAAKTLPDTHRLKPRIPLSVREDSDDPRWKLVQRMVASPSLGRSKLLSNFLLFVCDRYLDGRSDEITEQQIGIQVFGRLEGYKSDGDNIVRNYARTLRKRMEEYFVKEGRHESLILVIPRGAYVPVFAPRITHSPALELGTDLSGPADLRGSPKLESTSIRATEYETGVGSTTGERNFGSSEDTFEMGPNAGENSALNPTTGQLASLHAATSLPRRLWLAGAALGTIILSVVAGCLLERGPLQRWLHPGSRTAQINHLFWSRLFENNRDTFVVPADGGLVMLQSFIKRHVSLMDYATGNYGTQTEIAEGIVELARRTRPEDNANLEHKVEVIGSRRYTSIVDLDLTSHISRLNEVVPDRLMIRYARDLRIDDLRTGNVILLGSVDANPWVDLFQSQLNFQFSRGSQFGGSGVIINQHPMPGEQATYASEPNDPMKRTYGVIAYVPNLEGSGHVLIIEGINMAGTQAAGTFLLSPALMQPVLERAMTRNDVIQPFEILLTTGNIAANASRPQVLSERIVHY